MRIISKSLAEYYNKEYFDRENVVISEITKITLGWETELYSFIVEFDEAERQIREERVIRLYEGNFAVEKAAKEFRMMSYLFDAGYPVPEVFSLETDGNILGKPFIIMEKIIGHNMMEDLTSSSNREQESLMTRLIKLWVDLHKLEIPEHTDIKTTQEYIDQLLDSARNSIKAYGINWLEPVLDWLDEHKIGVPSERLSIIHRDFHPNNIMVREDGSMVVIDWGAVAIGDYRDDLAWTILLGITYLDPGFRKIVLEGYQKVSGQKVSGIEFFEVEAIFRRLQDVTISLKSGPEEMGMRSGALEMMKQDKEQFRRVYHLLEEKTGLKIHEFEQLLNTLEDKPCIP